MLGEMTDKATWKMGVKLSKKLLLFEIGEVQELVDLGKDLNWRLEIFKPCANPGEVNGKEYPTVDVEITVSEK